MVAEKTKMKEGSVSVVEDIGQGLMDEIQTPFSRGHPTVRENAIQGREYEKKEFAKQYNDAVEQVTIKTADGTKVRVDAIGIDKKQRK